MFWHRVGGAEVAGATIRKRGGGAYEPGIAQSFCEAASSILGGLDEEPTWESVLARDPGRDNSLSEETLDRACEALADFADIKSPYTIGHSTGVAVLAASAGQRYGLALTDVSLLRQGALSEREREQARLHAYYTDRVLARPGALARIAAMASQHHERVDGSGYHRGISAQMLSHAAPILAAADVYQAMTEPRPYRAAMSTDQAAEELRREVEATRSDGDAVNAVLAEAGHAVPRAAPATGRA